MRLPDQTVSETLIGSGRPERRFGSGWISGTIAATLGPMSLGAVFCLLYPELLTSPHLRAVYPIGLIRGLIHISIAASFLLGCLSLALRPSTTLGAIGVSAATLATLLGGAEVPITGPVRASNYIGLDWFLLDLFLLAIVFVPLERLFGRLREQPIFRESWPTDLTHFFLSHIVVQALILATMLPATVFFHWLLNSRFQAAVQAQPAWVQFLELIVIADLAEYWSHRAFHVYPRLWRFHAVHHSARVMDWLAGSRLHLVDSIATRAFVFLPLYAFGFSPAPLSAYLVFVSFHAVLLHANLRSRWPALEPWLGTPIFHHWHHALEKEAIDKNYAVHLPVLDRLFGTYYLPDRWPTGYGIERGPIPAESYWKQLVFPWERLAPSVKLDDPPRR